MNDEKSPLPFPERDENARGNRRPLTAFHLPLVEPLIFAHVVGVEDALDARHSLLQREQIRLGHRRGAGSSVHSFVSSFIRSN